MEDIMKYVQFIKEVEGLKSVTRSSFTATGRHESTAEHTWRLSLLAILMVKNLPELNLEKVISMCLIHDIGELYTGDIPAVLLPNSQDKYDEEYQAASKVFTLLPKSQCDELLRLWEEYNAGNTPESKFVKALDKAETIIQHNQGLNPPDFNYEFNLDYGKQYFGDNSHLQELRKIIDEDTSKHII